MVYNPGTSLIIITAVFATISVLTTAIRVGVKAYQRQLKWEDHIILLAMILLLCQTTFNGLQYRWGSGSHIGTLDPDEIMQTLKYVYITEFFLFFVVLFTKASICFFTLRIKNTRNLRYSLYALMGGLVITSGICEIVLGAQCQPIYAFWDRAAGTCWDPKLYNDVIWAQVAYSIFSDLVCTMLPIVVLWKVRISLRLKFAVCGLMSLGLLATICAAVRASLSVNDTDPDLTYSLAFISIWATLEEHLGIIAANLALSRYVWIFFFGDPDNSRNASKLRGAKYQYERHDSPTSRSRGAVPKAHLGGSAYYHDYGLDTMSHESERPLDQSARSNSPFEYGGTGIQRTTEVHVTRSDV